ncbi:MAG: YdcF family protein [Methylocystis sp.]
MTTEGQNSQPPKFRAARLAVLAGVSICAFALSMLVAGFIAFATSLERIETKLLARAEAVVAFTGGSDRVLEAVELLARGQAGRLLITGVNRSTQGAVLERLLPVSKDLFACCIDLGYRALDTAGNARETRDWARDHKIAGPLIVVTSNYHMPRAMVELSAAMPGVALYPFPVISEHVNVADWLDDTRVLKLLTREYLKYLRAIARTNWERVAGESAGDTESSEEIPRERRPMY